MDINPTETTVVSQTPAETQPSLTGDAETSRNETAASRFSGWRRSKAVSAETAAEQRRLRDARRRDEETARIAAANASARRSRKAAADRQDAAASDDVQAPVPAWMRVTGIWSDRSVSGLVRMAPLLVSGTATMMVGMAQPLDMGWPIALAFTLGLEGSLWAIQRLREQFVLEGIGTTSLAAAIYGIITLIFSLVFGHAIWVASGSKVVAVTVPLLEARVPLSDVVPAIAVALMSAIGVFVWAKTNAFKNRVKLRAENRLDPPVPKFSPASWVFCPWETIWSLRHAVKYRLSSPVDAVEDWRLWKMCNKPAVWPLPSLETPAIETPETSRPSQPLRVVSTTGLAETSQPSLVSAPRLLAPSRETAIETARVSPVVSRDGRRSETAGAGAETPVSAPPVSETADIVETVGRLHMELRSYAAVGERLGLSKAQAGRHGKTFYERNGAPQTAAVTD
jgi:hypothetical protein